MFVDSLVGSGGGGGNTGGFSNFIPVDDIDIEKIAERFVGQENPAILCIRNNDTGDLIVVHIPGVNNGEIYIDGYETNVFSDMDCSAVNIYSSHYAGSTVNVEIVDQTYGNLIYHLVLDYNPEGTSEYKYDSFDAYCTVFIMFLDGYYS